MWHEYTRHMTGLNFLGVPDASRTSPYPLAAAGCTPAAVLLPGRDWHSSLWPCPCRVKALTLRVSRGRSWKWRDRLQEHVERVSYTPTSYGLLYSTPLATITNSSSASTMSPSLPALEVSCATNWTSRPSLRGMPVCLTSEAGHVCLFKLCWMAEQARASASCWASLARHHLRCWCCSNSDPVVCICAGSVVSCVHFRTSPCSCLASTAIYFKQNPMSHCSLSLSFFSLSFCAGCAIRRRKLWIEGLLSLA